MEFFWYYSCTHTGMPNKLMFCFCFYFLEERIISRFGSLVVEFFWYYCCIITGMLFICWSSIFVFLPSAPSFVIILYSSFSNILLTQRSSLSLSLLFPPLLKLLPFCIKVMVCYMLFS